MRRFLWTALVVAAPAFGAPAKAVSPQLDPASGVTPGGSIFVVNPATRHLVLKSPEGGTRSVMTLQANERLVVAVADDGARVTSSRRRGGFDRDDGALAGAESRTRFVFRNAAGDVLATRELASTSESAPVAFGSDVYSVKRRSGDVVLLRSNASELETEVLRVPVQKALDVTGKLERITIHASGSGVLLELHGPYRHAYADARRRGALLVPEAPSCGGQSFDMAFPVREGGLGRIETRYEGAGSPRHALETLDGEGRLRASADLGRADRIFRLPAGILSLDGDEAVVTDDRGTEVSRAAFSLDEEAAPSGAAARLHAAGRRFAALGSSATGADAAELALAAPSYPYEAAPVAARDPQGFLDRLADVPDGSADAPSAKQILEMFVTSRGFEYAAASSRAAGREAADPGRWDRLLRHAEARGARTDAPRWFARGVAIPILLARKDDPPAWALESLAAAIADGDVPDGLVGLPPRLLTPELAESAALHDRDRIDRLEREHPELEAGLFDSSLSGGLSAAVFHVPARYPGLLLSCLLGAGTLRFNAVLAKLSEPGVARHRPAPDSAEDAAASADVVSDASAGAVGAALLVARDSDSALVRAAVQILAPLYGIPLDTASVRKDVLPNASATALSLATLGYDLSLSSATWTQLYSSALLASRSRSPDPLACATANGILGSLGPEDDEAAPDPYCQLLTFALASEYGAEGPGGKLPRQAEIDAWTNSAAAPAEIRLHARVLRAFSPDATDAERIEVWKEKDLPLSTRRLLFARDETASPTLAAEWRRELREGGGTPAEEALLIESVKAADPEEAARLAAERFAAGRVPLDEGSVNAWTKALDTKTVALDARLREKLEKLLDDEVAGPEVAAVLAKAGDATALLAVTRAVRTGCLH